MAAAAPLEVGTRGTVGSLLMREIEYFRRLELDSGVSSCKPQSQIVEMASTARWRPIFGFLLVMTWRRKKRRGSWFRPSTCSAIEVAESDRLNGIPGFSYRNLRADID
ncbi:hypothetical protein RJ641_018075 [Dillenia turbinata]|uniref:Uncharacterized protein n=1 Tax=Dillenia turbinata TaxID=194707 RepID=A0AAN8YW66_9MAGN